MKSPSIVCENIFLYKNLSYKTQRGAGFLALFAEAMCNAVRLISKQNIL